MPRTKAPRAGLRGRLPAHGLDQRRADDHAVGQLATARAWSGVEMPKPTASGRSCDRAHAPTNSARSGGSAVRAPVTPVSETR